MKDEGMFEVAPSSIGFTVESWSVVTASHTRPWFMGPVYALCSDVGTGMLMFRPRTGPPGKVDDGLLAFHYYDYSLHSMMSLAKLKVAFKGKSMAKCNLGATPPAPMMGRPAAQSSQKIRQTVALVPSTSTPGVQGQGAPVGDREDIGPAPVNRRKFLRLQASMKTLRSLFPQRRQNEGEEQAETGSGNESHSSLSICTVLQGNTPSTEGEHSSQDSSLQTLVEYSTEEERIVNPILNCWIALPIMESHN
ncbi:hypothetical protein M404DRAFT_8929 [Pisolithus tinctorius Marx 270]|uniref:Uncharacterized protein n=1 Tax=Pisolithus tinctorius Marx 270 TaxID=870435 RepID=A0A0C3J9I8_PISTI|nr:hypothetical protein M404DRAFT_8929 [Pisolithus tinctorius Marx 270]